MTKLKHNFKISLAIPVLNGASTIENTINSVLAQTYSNYEINISVNYCSDNTLDIVERIARNNNKIRIKKQKELISMTENIEESFSMCEGEYTMFLPADDILVVDALQILVALARKYPNATLVQGRYDFINTQGEVIGRGSNLINTLFERYLKKNKAFMVYCAGPISETCATLFKTELLNKENLEHDFQRVQIWDLYSRFLKHGGAAITPKLVALYRMHPLYENVHETTIKEKISLIEKQKKYFNTKKERKYFSYFVLYPMLFKLNNALKDNSLTINTKQLIHKYLYSYNERYLYINNWPFDELNIATVKFYIKKILHKIVRLILKHL